MIPKKETGRDALRAHGLRLTRPRRMILDVVRATAAHPTAAFVYQCVRRRLPRVSLATVHRNLRRLAAEGFLAEQAREPFATSEVALVIEHPNERARTVLSHETTRHLLEDLA